MPEGPKQQKVAGWLLRNWEWPLTFLAAAGAFLIFRDYGIGWDSEEHARYGEKVLDYFLRGMQRPEETETGYIHFYGWLFDLPSAALHRMLGLDRHTLRGLISALFAVATLPALVGIARRIGGERLAVFSCMVLILMPQFFGQAFINPKDIPLACTVTWATLAICRLLEQEDAGWPRFLGLGVAFGAVLSIRVGGVFVVVFLVAAGVWRWLPAVVAGDWRRARPAHPAAWAVKSLTALVLAWALMVSAWPFAHKNPFLNPIQAFRLSSAFPDVYVVLFNGRLYDSNALPVTYLPAYLALNLPLLLLALVLGGGGLALVACLRGWRQRESGALFLVLFWVAFPLAYVVIKRPTLYDGARHFIFVLPALALLGGNGLMFGVDFLRRQGGRAVEAAGLLTFAVVAMVPLIRWHPYQYAYLNALSGDRATLHRRYETDYWKTSYKAAAEWLNEQQALSTRPLTVVAAAGEPSSTCLVHFLDPRIQWQLTMDHLGGQPLPPEVDYYVGTTRFELDENFNRSPVVWEERREGVLFCVIRSERHAVAR